MLRVNSFVRSRQGPGVEIWNRELQQSIAFVEPAAETLVEKSIRNQASKSLYSSVRTLALDGTQTGMTFLHPRAFFIDRNYSNFWKTSRTFES